MVQIEFQKHLWGKFGVEHIIFPCKISYLTLILFHRERPAAISIEIKSIDDTSNFDEFPESDILKSAGILLIFLFYFILRVGP